MNLAPRSCTPSTHRRHTSSIEVLENRIALNASPLQIAKALDLPTGTTVEYTGDPTAVSTLSFANNGAFVGFPSGADDDFLVMSTGDASAVTSANTSGSQGTDLGESGVAGDLSTVKFSLKVPASATEQKFKFDFVFLSEEFPEFVGSSFNDIFTATVNGQNIARDQFGSVISVNNAFFSGESAAGTFFDGRTSKLTATYAVPAGVTTLDVQFQINDVGDGSYDSAAFIDNVRFETSQVIFLDFDGGTVVDLFGAGTVVNIPAFQASDVDSDASAESVIATIVSGLQAKFAAYDVVFTATQPAAGTYATLVIGGDNSLPVDFIAASPAFKAQFGNADTTLRDIAKIEGTMLGQAAPVDFGNLVRQDVGVVFSGEFDNFYAGETSGLIVSRLIVTAAHELGHNLGLRDVANTEPQDIMQQNSARNSDATFGNAQLNLAESWSDGATRQNDSVYLKSILGSSDGSTTLVQSFVALQDLFSGYFSQPIYDFTIQFDSSIGEIGEGTDFAPLVLHFDKFDGSQPIALPILPMDTKFSFYGASKKNGPIDLMSGTPVNGTLAYENTFFDLFEGGSVASLNVPVTKGQFGKLQPAGTFFLSSDALPGNAAKFTDTDGDIVTVTLKGPGLISVVQDDANNDGKGGLERITLNGTDPGLSSLSVSVAKYKGVKANPKKEIVGIPAGNGLVDIGEIIGADGAGLKAIAAADADVTDRIEFAGAVGTIVLHDLQNGADLTTGEGAPAFKSSFTAAVIGNGSTLDFGTALAAFTATRVGLGEITAPAIAKFTIKGDAKAGIQGDLGSDLTLPGALGKVVVAGQVNGVTITAKGVSSFTAGSFIDSSLFAGFVPTNVADPLAGGTFDAASAIKSFNIKAATAGFANSYLGSGQIGNVTIASLIASNGGQRFGIISATTIGSVKVKDPAFTFTSAGSDDQSVLDFHVVRV